ncbi:MAG: anhydro-N-acetylmuramic acid kinase [Ignavibacteriae bacterium]|nr:anhydro-N-acetylmuramic acid kinase [Ignavibacteriota bacterium]
MKNLINLISKEKKYVIGLMSGTSIDAVDVALIEINGSGVNTKLNLIGYLEYSYPDGFKELVLRNSTKDSSNVEEICRLNFLIPQFYNDAIDKLCNHIGFDKNEIDLIGSHGQTIHHLPAKQFLFDKNSASTLQIGDPSVLAKLSGIITVGDFRVGDVALGGQGAPLVPYFDFIIFHSNEKSRALLNIGGIANFTILDKVGSVEDIYAFDTGPGNMLSDILSKRFFDKQYDEDGNFALSGKINEDLFNALLLKDNYIKAKPPKSTGREYYGEKYLSLLLDEFKDVNQYDWLTTAAELTAFAIYDNYKNFVQNETEIEELIISGGGAKNKYIYKRLKEYFGDKVELKIIDEIGLSSDAKEAVCFAVLANETISGNCANVPKTTGASKPTILGKICLP